ncbi:MAG TPA: AraC family transcriptional regulator ligand-binding domain-containing protein [Burkholderiaceae bacterium]
MPVKEAVIPLRYARPLFDFVREQRPQALQRILDEAGLPAPPVTGSGRLSTAQFDALIGAATRALERTDIGFEIGLRVNIDSHDALSIALRACRTIDAMLRTAARYSRLISPVVSIQYRRDEAGGEYLLRPRGAMSQTTLYASEEIFALAVHADVRARYGTTRGLEIFFSMPQPKHAARYRALAPTRFVFAANALPEVRCRLPASMLDRPLADTRAAPNPTLLDELRAADSAAGRDRGKHGIRDWIVLILNEAEGVQPSLADLAALLEVSERTLSRRLAAEGADLRRLSRDIRAQRACALLTATALPVEHIGQRLGYASIGAFSMAFKTIFGVSPMQYRQGRRAVQ